MELCYVVIFTIIINSAMIDKHIKNLGKVYEMGRSGHFVLVWYKTIHSALKMAKNSEIYNVIDSNTLIGSG